MEVCINQDNWVEKYLPKFYEKVKKIYLPNYIKKETPQILLDQNQIHKKTKEIINKVNKAHKNTDNSTLFESW